MSEVWALYADEAGGIFDAPGLTALGNLGGEIISLMPEDLIPLPEGSDLMFLPKRRALGRTANGEVIPIAGQAVAALLPPGYTRTLLPAYERKDTASPLPLYGYTAVALYRDKLWVAALPTDANDKWHPYHYNTKALKKLIKNTQKVLPNNPIVSQLAKCSLEWHCSTAQNLFYHRWEAGIPTSPVCNADCLGCISLQRSECCPSPQSRITFRPTPAEIAQVGVYHLKEAPEAIVSFGQGCEGEPALAADNIAAGIRLMREATDRGQINMNSNGGFTAGVKKIVAAGLDSLRVSIISPLEGSYAAYYRCGYGLSEVRESIRCALEQGVYVSLNLLYFPGFNDREEELAGWREFLRQNPVQMVQLRNLNLDPEVFLAAMSKSSGRPLGVKKFLQTLQEDFPQLVIGSFSHFKRQKRTD